MDRKSLKTPMVVILLLQNQLWQLCCLLGLLFALSLLKGRRQDADFTAGKSISVAEVCVGAPLF